MMRVTSLVLIVATTSACASAPVAAGASEMLIPAGPHSASQQFGSYGTVQAFGPSGGVPIPADLKRALQDAGAVYAVLEGFAAETDDTMIDLYLVTGWNYQDATSEVDVSFQNLLGSVGPGTKSAGSRGIDLVFEVRDFRETDAGGETVREGRVRSFLKGADIIRATLVLLTRKGRASFAQLRITTRRP